MGAISSTSSIPILREYLDDPERTVRETCEIALAKIEWDNSEEGRLHNSRTQEVETETQCDAAACPDPSNLLTFKIHHPESTLPSIPRLLALD